MWSSVRVFPSRSVWQSAAVWMLNLAASAPPLLDKAWHHLPALWLVERDAGSWWAGMAGSADRGWLTLCWKLVSEKEREHILQLYAEETLFLLTFLNMVKNIEQLGNIIISVDVVFFLRIVFFYGKLAIGVIAQYYFHLLSYMSFLSK